MNKILPILIYMLFLFAAATGCQQKPASTQKSEAEKHDDHDHEGHDRAPGDEHDDEHEPMPASHNETNESS